MWMRDGWRGTRIDAPRSRLPRLAAAMAFGLVGALSGVSLAGQAVAPAPTKPRLAVAPFTGSAATLPEGYGVAPRQAIHDALRQLRAVRPVDAEEIVGASGRLGLALSDGLADDALIRLARELQVRGLIAGSFAVGRRDRDDPGAPRGYGGSGPGHSGARRSPVRPATSWRRRAASSAHALQQFQVRPTELDERRLETAFAGGTASLEAYTLYARAAWEQGLGTKEAHERAVALFTKALEADQNFAQARVALGAALYATADGQSEQPLESLAGSSARRLQINSEAGGGAQAGWATCW